MKCLVAARLILSRLKLHDLLDVEMKRLQQQAPKHQRALSSLDGSGCPSPVTILSSSQSLSAAASSASSSQPFELPDVDISDLLSLTVQSPKNVRSSLVDCRRTSSTLSATTRRPSGGDRSRKQKDAGSKTKADENCSQNNVRDTGVSRTATGDKSSVTATVTAVDSRKRPASGRCTVVHDSDEDFEEFQCSSMAKKRAEERQYVDSIADGRSVAAGEISQKCDVESSSKRNKTAMVTYVTECPASVGSTVSNALALDSGTVQQNVAQRLSRFAFNDSCQRQRRELSTCGTVTCVKSQGRQNTQHSIGKCRILSSFAQFCMYRYICVLEFH